MLDSGKNQQLHSVIAVSCTLGKKFSSELKSCRAIGNRGIIIRAKVCWHILQAI